MNKVAVDHYLQASMLARLAASSRPLRFTELKEDGVENSLFMYHANKLLARGLVIKSEDGFSLTVNGARWVNFSDTSLMNSKPAPRLLVQLVIRHEDSLLLSVRKGQLKELLNDYMLPGGLHKVGLSADQNAARLVQKLFGDPALVATPLTILEDINTYEDFTYHSVVSLYEVRLASKLTPAQHERFAYEWIREDHIKENEPQFERSKILPQLVAKLHEDALPKHLVITSEYN